MKRKIRIAISSYKHNTPLKQHILFLLLGEKYDLKISDTPDLFFYSDKADFLSLLKYNCVRIFFTGENVKPDFRDCDYAFSFEDTDDKNFNFPNFARFSFFEYLRSGKFRRSYQDRGYPDESKVREYRRFPQSEFCGLVSSNFNGKERIEFCQKLMSYKKVDCPGKVLNNMAPIASGKPGAIEFFKRYKFGITFENTSTVNYTTEKICWPLLTGGVPIYWGNPKVVEYFNPEAFINCHDYDSFDRAIDHVIEVDNNDALYQKYVNASPILAGSKLHAITEQAVMERLDKIVATIDDRPVSAKTSSSLRCYSLRGLNFILRRYPFLYSLYRMITKW